MDLLKKAPLVEAVCEIVFSSPAPPDLTIPGILYSGLKTEYPIKKDKPLIQVALRDPGSNQIILHTTPVTQFFNLQSNRVLQVGNHLFVINFTSEYPGWETFSSEIVKVFKLYTQNQEALSIRQISLRYINLFYYDERLNEMVSFQLPNPPSEKYLDNRAVETLVEYSDETNVLSKSFKTIISPEPPKKSCILELTYMNAMPNGVKIDELEQWLEKGHEAIKHLFVDSLNPEYLETLK